MSCACVDDVTNKVDVSLPVRVSAERVLRRSGRRDVVIGQRNRDKKKDYEDEIANEENQTCYE